MTQQDKEKFNEICKKLNIREETVDGFDEQAYVWNFFMALRTTELEEIKAEIENIMFYTIKSKDEEFSTNTILKSNVLDIITSHIEK